MRCLKLLKWRKSDPDYIKASPHKTVVGRLDNTLAARNPVLKE